MGADVEAVLGISQGNQARAQKRTLPQIERLPDPRTDPALNLRLLRTLGQTSQVLLDDRQADIGAGMDNLDKLAVVHVVSSSPDFVASNHLAKTLFQDRDVHRAQHLQGDALVVRSRITPEPPLVENELLL